MRPYAAVTFLSALLLFLVQPLVARAILPWFGGAASVWTTCLLFYQTLLLAGYAYAHLSRRLGVRRQALLHVALAAASLALLPITPPDAWRPAGPEAPTARLLALLTVSVGGPYLVLAGTTPLLHDWFGRSHLERSPYPLYAVSNAGSLVALVAYPTLVEPFLPVRAQGLAWSWAYAVFAAALAAVVWRATRMTIEETGRAWEAAGGPAREAAGGVGPGRERQAAGGPRRQDAAPDEAAREPAASGRRPPVRDILFWLSLSACGSGLLLAVSEAVTQDVASVPLLWILPLALYLLTFILAFSGRYRRGAWGALLVLALGATALLWAGGFALPVVAQAALASGVLLAGCMVCNGELARSAPAPGRLTTFYLTMAAGGVVGGALVAVAAPALLPDTYELPAFVLLAYALLLVALQRESTSVARRARVAGARIALGAVLVAALAVFAAETRTRLRGTVATARDFYGVLRVQDRPPGLMSHLRVLRHGRIFHGAEFLDPGARGRPTAYFVRGSGVELAIRTHYRRVAGEPLRIGVIGLGVGTLAAWGRKGDTIRFYELDPEVERLARRWFTYLDAAAARVDVVRGDGRLSLQQDMRISGGRALYDILVVDAFAGDAVPVHLLTRECAELYRAAVGRRGLVVFQVTNRHVDLERVVRGLADALGMRAIRVDQDPPEGSGGLANAWMVLAPSDADLPDELMAAARPGVAASERPPVLWTDDFSNLLGVLR